MRLSIRALCICLLLALAACSTSNKGISHRLPRTLEEIEKYVKRAEDKVSVRIEKLASLPFDQTTFDNTLKEWNRLGNDLMESFTTLAFLSRPDFSCSSSAQQAMQIFETFLKEKLEQHPRIFESLFAYVYQALSSGTPSKYENHLIDALIQSTNSIKERFPEEYIEVFDHLKKLSIKYEKQPFNFQRGNASPAKGAETGGAETGFTLLSLNTCFLPGNQTYLYGGMAPWEKRVTAIAEKIRTSGADLVCLQEVFAEDASDALFAALKDSYAYFYTSIGPRPPGVAFETLGLPSGLFVASKYPLDDPHFTLPSASAFPINYGCFDFVVKNGKTSLAHVYVAHLQPQFLPEYRRVRAAQLKEIVEKMRKDASKNGNMPFLLCGDLNIPCGSKEPAEALIEEHFYNAYTQNIKSMGDKNWTSTDYFTNQYIFPDKSANAVDPNFQILDYALLLKTSRAKNYSVETTLFPMYSLEKPDSSISDHHGLFTKVQLLRPTN